jgi:hypothetical protein
VSKLAPPPMAPVVGPIPNKGRPVFVRAPAVVPLIGRIAAAYAASEPPAGAKSAAVFRAKTSAAGEPI